MHHEVRIDIAAPAEIVWRVLANVERWPDWTPSVRSVELLDGALAIGARVRIRQPKFPVVVWQLTSIEPGRAFTWESVSPGGKAIGRHTIIDNRDGTSTTVLSISQNGPLGSLIGLLTRRLTKRYVALEADGLRARSESLHEAYLDPREVW